MYIAIINPLRTWRTDGSDLGGRGQSFRPGVLACDENGNQYICGKNDNTNAAISAYDVCRLDADFGCSDGITSSTTLNTRSGYDLGVPQVSIPVGHSGWFQQRGVGRVNAIANTPINTRLQVSGTAGHLDNTTTGGLDIFGVTLTTARGSGNGDAPARFAGLHI